MDAFDPTEILDICEGILTAGEVSSDEAYGLAEWINAHPEACESWPANLLVAPLQSLWADGKVTKTELREFARVLEAIRRERIKQDRIRDRLHDQQQVAERIAEAVRTFNPWQPMVPSIAIVVNEKSQSEAKVNSQVDLTSPSCTCPDWIAYRSNAALQSLPRCCKHVLSALSHFGPEEGWPCWLGSLTESGHGVHPSARVAIIPLSAGPALFCTSNGPWCDIHGPKGRGYARRGFNLVEGRWAYGEAPEGAREIRQWINRNI